MQPTCMRFLKQYMIQILGLILLVFRFLRHTSKIQTCSAGDDVDADGTTIKSSGCCFKFVWDHGRHVQNFTHGESTLPELVLYQGTGYYSAFCTHMQQRYNNAVAFAFSSAFSISLDSTDDPALVSDAKDSDDKEWKTTPRNGTSPLPNLPQYLQSR
jgi:hypothetical protein